MNMNEYQKAAMSTAVYPKDRALEYTTLGLVGEAGEVANKVKKIIRGDKPLTEELEKDLAAELSDVLWYCAALASEIGWDLGDIAKYNINKLADRANRNQIKGSGDNR